jgi:hypothetical protein
MKKLFLPITFLFLTGQIFAQNVGINADGSNADPSSILDIKSTTQGFLTPRMTQNQRNLITLPATGLMIYQTDNTPGFYYYNGSAWERTATSTNASYTAGTGISISSNTITNTAPDQTVIMNAGSGISVTGTYPNFTVANSSPSSGGTVTSIIAGTGLSGGTITSSGTISLPNTGTAGTYGSATQVPVLTTDAQGRVTSVTNTTISGVAPSAGSSNYIQNGTSQQASSNFNISGNGTIGSNAIIGTGDATGTPVGGTLRAPNAGSGTTAGGNLNLNAGFAWGSGAGGSVFINGGTTGTGTNGNVYARGGNTGSNWGAVFLNDQGGTTFIGNSSNTTTLNGTNNFPSLTASAPVFTDASKNLTSSGTVGVANGGTGATTLTGVIKGNGTSAFTAMTGTANYVTRWTNANTLGIGIIRDNAARVGIGIDPDGTHVLKVGGRMFLDNGVIQAGGAAITTTSDLGLYSRTNGSWMRFVTNAANIRFYSDDGSGTNHNLTIESNGNVGIGNITPSSKLHVSGGSARISGTTNTNAETGGMLIYDNASGLGGGTAKKVERAVYISNFYNTTQEIFNDQYVQLILFANNAGAAYLNLTPKAGSTGAYSFNGTGSYAATGSSVNASTAGTYYLVSGDCRYANNAEQWVIARQGSTSQAVYRVTIMKNTANSGTEIGWINVEAYYP